MKKSLKCFSFILFCSLFMLFVSFSNVDARYDASKNETKILVSENEVKITVSYQRGLDKSTAQYVWCEIPNINKVVNSLNDCTRVLAEDKGPVSYIVEGGDIAVNYIAQGTSEHVDSNLTTYTFTIPKAKDPVLNVANGYLVAEQYYALVVTNNFCAVREGNSGSYSGCAYWDLENNVTVLNVSTNDILNHKVVGGDGTALDDIEDDSVRTFMDKIYEIVHGTVMPIIWVVLGIFLVVKGTLLGVQIVKAADEPQVRQEKVGSLKWLVIGVGIAYASSFVVDLVIGFFKGVFQ